VQLVMAQCDPTAQCDWRASRNKLSTQCDGEESAAEALHSAAWSRDVAILKRAARPLRATLQQTQNTTDTTGTRN
jgi:hypothetical protein